MLVDYIRGYLLDKCEHSLNTDCPPTQRTPLDASKGFPFTETPQMVSRALLRHNPRADSKYQPQQEVCCNLQYLELSFQPTLESMHRLTEQVDGEEMKQFCTHPGMAKKLVCTLILTWMVPVNCSTNFNMSRPSPMMQHTYS